MSADSGFFGPGPRLRGLLAGVFRVAENAVVPELCREEVGTWDSLKQMDLVHSLETEYGVVLEIGDIVGMVSVGEIARILREKGVRIED